MTFNLFGTEYICKDKIGGFWICSDMKFCTHENNHCKKRLKCYRYTKKHDPAEKIWFMDFWDLYGRECENFYPIGAQDGDL